MALLARDRRISRRIWLLAGLGIPLFRARSAPALPSLSVSFDGDNLHITIPGLHFLTGRALVRLKDADTVTFFSQITLSDERGELIKRMPDRFVVSYALWEEKFAVTIPGTARTTMHSTAAQAEAWAIENLAISALGLAPHRPFWLRFELRAATQKETASMLGETGISLRGVVEFLSRKSTPENPSWTLQQGPFRLADLPRTVFHGRNG